MNIITNEVNNLVELINKSNNIKEFYLNSQTYQLLLLTCVYNILWTYSLSELLNNVSIIDRIWTILPLLYTFIATFDDVFKNYLVNGKFNMMTIVDERCLILLNLQILWSIRLTYNTSRRGLLDLSYEDYRWPVLRSKLTKFQFKLLNLFCEYII